MKARRWGSLPSASMGSHSRQSAESMPITSSLPASGSRSSRRRSRPGRTQHTRHQRVLKFRFASSCIRSSGYLRSDGNPQPILQRQPPDHGEHHEGHQPVHPQSQVIGRPAGSAGVVSSRGPSAGRAAPPAAARRASLLGALVSPRPRVLARPPDSASASSVSPATTRNRCPGRRRAGARPRAARSIPHRSRLHGHARRRLQPQTVQAAGRSAARVTENTVVSPGRSGRCP